MRDMRAQRETRKVTPKSFNFTQDDITYSRATGAVRQNRREDAGGSRVRRCRPFGGLRDQAIHMRGRVQKRKGPSSVSLKGREPQAACTDMPWRRERAPRRSPGRTPARAAARKNEEAPCRLGRGPRESSGDLLSRTRGPGTIGDLRLNFRVRDGNGCDPHSITAETNSCMEI